MDLRIESIERITVAVPFRTVPARNMVRELPHWTLFELCRVTLASGAVGWGETMLYYTWGRTTEEAVARAQGQHAAALMWDDSLGAGLQMALFDAVGQALAVPVHALLGSQVHARTPLSWWDIDFSGEDWAEECRTLLAAGYKAFKSKGRPWWDLFEQLDAVAAVVPDDFEMDLDFNSTIPDAELARDLLPELERRYPFLKVFESPLPQSDVPGGRQVKSMTTVPIAMHYGEPAPRTVVQEGVCDGFVVSGGASRVMRTGRFAGEVGMPFWLQLVGTGLTAAFSLHFGAVLDQAVWPAVNCHQLYVHDLLRDPIVVENGTAAVPQQPGLGHAVDEAAVARYRVDPPAERPAGPRRLIVVHWGTGGKSFFTHGGPMLEYFMSGRKPLPLFARGTRTEVVFDDGRPEFADLHARAAREPVHELT